MSYYRPSTMHDLLQHTLAEYGELPYVHEYRHNAFQPTTYQEFIGDVRRAARLLNEQGYAGTRIMLYGQNSYQLLVFYFAITAYVGTAVCASKDWKAYDMKNAVRVSVPALVIGDGELLQHVPNDVPSQSLQSFFQTAHDMSEVDEALLTSYIRPSDALSVVIFTSGSTSLPKAVPLTLDTFFANGAALYSRVPSTSADSYYLFLPMHHVYSQACVTAAALVVGAKLFIAHDVRNFVEEASMVRPTIIFGVPLFYERVLSAISDADRRKIQRVVKVLNAIRASSGVRRRIFKKVHEAFGGTVQLLTSGGAPLKPSTKSFLRDVGFTVIEGYGMSESSGVVAAEYPTSRDALSVGTVLESQQVRIHEPDREGWGEIYVKGENFMPGYLTIGATEDVSFDAKSRDGPSEKVGFDTSCFTEDGYYKTGDIGRLGKGATLYVRGRAAKVLVLSSGEKVAIDELTQLVKQLGVDKVYFSEQSGYVAADIFSRLSDTALAEKIAQLNTTLPRYKQIQHYIHIKEYVLSEMK